MVKHITKAETDYQARRKKIEESLVLRVPELPRSQREALTNSILIHAMNTPLPDDGPFEDGWGSWLYRWTIGWFW